MNRRVAEIRLGKVIGTPVEDVELRVVDDDGDFPVDITDHVQDLVLVRLGAPLGDDRHGIRCHLIHRGCPSLFSGRIAAAT